MMRLTGRQWIGVFLVVGGVASAMGQMETRQSVGNIAVAIFGLALFLWPSKTGK